MTKMRDRMNEQGYSNRTLAAKVPCHFTLISKMAAGKRNVRMETAKRVSELIGVPMEDLIATKGK
jgi:plasmid maintenance system antidote protein VapI